MRMSLVLLALLVSCGGSKVGVDREVGFSLEELPEHTGVLIRDLNTGEKLWSWLPDRLFVPASTTKILTWHLVRGALGVRPIAFWYDQQQGDGTLILRPNGYPLLGLPGYEDRRLVDFIRRYDTVLLLRRPRQFQTWGPGWSWEDYPFPYSTDRSLLPVYGNRLWVWKKEPDTSRVLGDMMNVRVPTPLGLLESPEQGVGYEVLPRFFRDSIHWRPEGATEGKRERFRNRFFLSPPPAGDSIQVPWITSEALALRAFTEFTGVPTVVAADTIDTYDIRLHPFPGAPLDSMIKPMLIESDNFLAEQLWVMTATGRTGERPLSAHIDSLVSSRYPAYRGRIRIVDGSGLSRYNLCSPRLLTDVLLDIHRLYGPDYWQEMLPSIELEAYTGDTSPPPRIYAKTGSMGGVYNLAGYMQTRKGKWVAFAIMNNHFVRPREEVVRKTYDLLRAIHQTY